MPHTDKTVLAQKLLEKNGFIMTLKLMLCKKVSREHRIPFEITADPFYSESNMAHLRWGIAALASGKGVEQEPLLEDGE